MEKERLISIQNRLRERLVLEDSFPEIKYVGGADVAYSKDKAYCTIAVLNYDNMSLIEETTTVSRAAFPYVPGFLIFRESGPIIKTFRAVNKQPDVLTVDGHGIAHPRNFGLASHIGVLLNIPTIGVAKNPLVGEFTTPKKEGDIQGVSFDGDEVGFVLKSKLGSKPIFISPGHRVSLESSLSIIKKCLSGSRLPEPLRLAHVLSKKAANG